MSSFISCCIVSGDGERVSENSKLKQTSSPHYDWTIVVRVALIKLHSFIKTTSPTSAAFAYNSLGEFAGNLLEIGITRKA